MNIEKLAKIMNFLTDNGYGEDICALGNDIMFMAGPEHESTDGSFLKNLGACWSEEYECWEVLF